MHDPKSFNNEPVQRFEKEVQQKMEELEFSPSEAVWANVAQAVNGGKKRRRAPLFWFFFLPALLLVGAAGLYFMGGHSPLTERNSKGIYSLPDNNPPSGTGQPSANSQQKKKEQQPGLEQHPGNDQRNARQNDQPTGNNQQLKNDQRDQPNDQQPDQQPNTQLTTNTQSATNGLRPDHKLPNAQPATNGLHPDHKQPNIQSAAITPSSPDKPTALRSGGFHHPATGKPQDSRTNSRTDIRTDNHTDSRTDNNTDNIPEPAATAGNLTIARESTPKVSRINLSPVSGKSSPKITAAPLVSKSLAKTQRTPLSHKRPWEAGFAGGVGVSSLNQGFLKRSPAVVAAYDNRNSMAAITGQPQVSVSKIQPDLSFWAGIFMQKPLLNDLSVSIGLNLHYYSTRIATGDKVDLGNGLASLPVGGPGLYTGQALSNFTAAAAPPQSYPYYTAGDKHTYINRYYSLEIPVSIQWQLTHSRVLPLFWEAGVSLAYLMSSNALYYNPKAGVYYKDGNVTNKIQFNLATALMVGLPVKGIDLRAGPQVQYGLTSLLNTENTGQHLFYAGLKLVVIPPKSGKAGRHRFGDQ